MRELLIVLFLLIAKNIYPQNLELVGKVEYYDLRDTGKIYYTEEGKKFDTNMFVTYG